MLKKKLWLVITFHTNEGVMQLDKRAKQNNVDGKLIPVPHDIVVDCGTAWRTLPENREKLEKLITDLDYDRILEMEI